MVLSEGCRTLRCVTALLRSLDDPGYDVSELEHYVDEDARWRARTGNAPGGPLRRADGTFAPVPAYMRLDRMTDKNGPIPEHRPDLGPCWVFTGGRNKGYGYIGVGKRNVQAYRVNYERYVGPIPPGAVMDHLCRNRACVHPLHVEPTTYRENAVRSPIHPAMVKGARIACPAGHPWDEENTRYWNGVRLCRACQREQKRDRTGAEARPASTSTHCAQGHPWEGNLRILPSGRRQCTTCNRLAGQQFRERARAQRDAKGEHALRS